MCILQMPLLCTGDLPSSFDGPYTQAPPPHPGVTVTVLVRYNIVIAVDEHNRTVRKLSPQAVQGSTTGLTYIESTIRPAAKLRLTNDLLKVQQA